MDWCLAGISSIALVIAYVLLGFALFSFTVSVDLLYVIALELLGVVLGLGRFGMGTWGFFWV